MEMGGRISFVDENGQRVVMSDSQIEAELDQPMHTNASDGLGKARRIDDAAGRYIEAVKASAARGLDLSDLKIVIDCANGAAYKVAPTVLWELGAEVIWKVSSA